jgi:hypothetical protein
LKGSVAAAGDTAGVSAGRTRPRGNPPGPPPAAPPGGVADLFRIKAEMTTKCNSCDRVARHSDPCIELRLNLKVSACLPLPAVALCGTGLAVGQWHCF